MFNTKLVRPTEEEMKKENMPRPTFQEKYLLSPSPVSFNFSSHAKEVLKVDIPEEGKGMERGKRMEEKKVKANGKRGRGKGATE